MLVSTNLEDYNYAICGEQFEETLEHLFIHCSFASQCWCTLEFRSFANFGRLQGNSTSTILHGDFQVKYNFTMVIHPPAQPHPDPSTAGTACAAAPHVLGTCACMSGSLASGQATTGGPGWGCCSWWWRHAAASQTNPTTYVDPPTTSARLPAARRARPGRHVRVGRYFPAANVAARPVRVRPSRRPPRPASTWPVFRSLLVKKHHIQYFVIYIEY